MIFGGSYADSSVPDWRAGVAIFILGALSYLGWCAIAHIGAFVGGLVGYPAAGVVTGVFGVPILAILINGWRAAKHDGEVK